MNSLPLISIVTPSFNQAQYLEEAITSVLNQGYPRLEYLIMDGGSTDGSANVIRRYAERLAHWVSAPDAGPADAINLGWRQAHGDVLGWLNADDRLRPGALAQVGRAFASRPAPIAVVGGGANIDARGRVLGEKPPQRLDLAQALLSQTFHQPSVFLARETLDTVGPLNIALSVVFDWEYWLRLLLVYPPEAVHYIDSPLAENRIWPGTKTRQAHASGQSAAERRRVLEDLFAGPALPEAAQGLRARAMAATYWRQGHIEREAGRARQALASVRRAHDLAPDLYPWNPAWAAQFWAQTYVRYPFWLLPYWAARKAWRILRRLAARGRPVAPGPGP